MMAALANFRVSVAVFSAVLLAGGLSSVGGGEARAASAVEQGFVPPSIGYHGQGRALAPRHQAGPEATLRDFLARRGWRAASLDALRADSTMRSSNGQTILVLNQVVDGLAVQGAYAKAIFGVNGELLDLSGSLVETDGLVFPARIEARQALDAALRRVYPDQLTTLREVGRTDTVSFYGGDRFFYGQPKVTRVAVQDNPGILTEGFLVELWSADDNQLDLVLVDHSGKVLEVQNRTADDSYSVFLEHPGKGAQTTVTGPETVSPAGTTPSPAGWLNGAQQYATSIQGNNAKAYLDRDNNNLPDAASTQVNNATFNAAANLSLSPTDPTNQAVAVQNLFYLNNAIHDDLYRYGFTESARNFQFDNFVRGGVANDPVNAEAQDGGGTNNANFATPNDGASPRMQMYLWTLSTPNRDGDVDGDIVWHEYGHGLTWRIINNMTGIMGGALGEGASDVLAIIKYNDGVLGEYSYNNPNGIRSHSYDNYAATGRTYESVCAGGCEVHRDGEIFAAIMWDMWTRYRDDSALLASNRRDAIMTDVVDGMKHTLYQCTRPTFPTMRDGILKSINGGSDPNLAPANADAKARWCHTWSAFAKFGVGTDQSTTCTQTISQISWTWANGFQVPAACSTTSTNSPPVANNQSVTTAQDTPVAITLTATDADNNPLTYAVVSGPLNGTLSGSAPNLTYAPTGGYSGPDSFTFKANDGAADSNVATVSITVTPGGGATTMHVASLGNVSTKNSKWWSAKVLVTIRDNLNAVVANATVTGAWSNGASGSASCLTNSIGQCTLTKSKLALSLSSVTFTVTNVSLAPLSWDKVSSSLNVARP